MRQVTRTSLLAGGALTLGAGLRIWQWSAGTSMWYDELRIAQNVRDRGLGELLFEPLAYQQMAPHGFLASVDVSTARNLPDGTAHRSRLRSSACACARARSRDPRSRGPDSGRRDDAELPPGIRCGADRH
jgi:hypothetical protein